MFPLIKQLYYMYVCVYDRFILSLLCHVSYKTDPTLPSFAFFSPFCSLNTKDTPFSDTTHYTCTHPLNTQPTYTLLQKLSDKTKQNYYKKMNHESICTSIQGLNNEYNKRKKNYSSAKIVIYQRR